MMNSSLVANPVLTSPPTATVATVIEQGITRLLNDCPVYLHRELTCSHLRQKLVAFVHDRLSQNALKTISEHEIQVVAQAGLHYLLQEETLRQMKHRS